MKRSKYIFDGEVYNVKERMYEAGVPMSEADENPDWYEYNATLLNRKTGQLVDEWDSLSETYNGVQRLTKAKAEASVAEIAKDVKSGHADKWFIRAEAENFGASSKPKKTKKAGKAPRPRASLGGVRR